MFSCGREAGADESLQDGQASSGSTLCGSEFSDWEMDNHSSSSRSSGGDTILGENHVPPRPETVCNHPLRVTSANQLNQPRRYGTGGAINKKLSHKLFRLFGEVRKPVSEHPTCSWRLQLTRIIRLSNSARDMAIRVTEMIWREGHCSR